MDALPDFILENHPLSGNELAALASVEHVPAYNPSFRDQKMEAVLMFLKGDRKTEVLYQHIRDLIQEKKIDEAWQVILHSQEVNHQNQKTNVFSTN